MEFTLWSLVAVCIISFVPLYLVLLKSRLRTRSQMRMQEKIDELKQRIEIEKGLITYSSDVGARIDCENKLFLFTNELCRLERKLAKRNKKINK